MGITLADFDLALGKPAVDPATRGLLAALGCFGAVELEGSVDEGFEPTRYVVIGDRGIIFVFELPGETPASKDNEALLALKTVQLYPLSPQNGITVAYAGELPAGLSFADTPDDARRKLGPPTRSTPGLDVWKVDGHRITAEYDAERTRIRLVQYRRA